MADLDHRYMTPPSLRLTDERRTPGGDTVGVWDLRVAQPNVTHLEMPVVHSLEHFLGDYFRRTAPKITGFAPMGCQTGFYIFTMGSIDFAELSDLVASGLEEIAKAREVPLANDRQCGWARNHTLAGAQEVAAWLLRHRGEWASAGSEADPVAGS